MTYPPDLLITAGYVVVVLGSAFITAFLLIRLIDKP